MEVKIPQMTAAVIFLMDIEPVLKLRTSFYSRFSWRLFHFTMV